MVGGAVTGASADMTGPKIYPFVQSNKESFLDLCDS